MAKGIFKPTNPQKYLGDPTKIVFRSSWELRMMINLDSNIHILAWGSEEIRIKYIHPFKKTKIGKPKICDYLPDFIVKYKDKNGNMLTEILEVKPSKETSVAGRKKVSTYDQLAIIVNNSKWQAAQAFCKQYNMKFRVITEKDIFR